MTQPQQQLYDTAWVYDPNTGEQICRLRECSIQRNGRLSYTVTATSGVDVTDQVNAPALAALVLWSAQGDQEWIADARQILASYLGLTQNDAGEWNGAAVTGFQKFFGTQEKVDAETAQNIASDPVQQTDPAAAALIVTGDDGSTTTVRRIAMEQNPGVDFSPPENPYAEAAVDTVKSAAPWLIAAAGAWLLLRKKKKTTPRRRARLAHA